MVAPILRGLVAVLLSVTFTEAGTVEKGQAQGAVVRLIRAVLAVRKHSHTVSATSVGEVEPLVRGNFVLLGVIVASLNGADIPIVGRLRIRSGQGEASLEGGLAGLPVDDIGEFDTIAGATGRETDRLDEPGGFGFAFDLEGHTNRTVFGDAYPGRPLDKGARRLLLVCPVHIPGGPIPGLFSLERQTRWGGKEFAVDGLVEDAGHVAVLVHLDAVAGVFQRRLGDFQRRSGSGRLARLNVVNSEANGRRRSQEQDLRRCGAPAPAIMSWKWPHVTSVQALFSRCRG